MNVPVQAIGSAGIVADLSPFDIPLQAWTRAHNVRALGQALEKTRGQGLVTAVAGGPHTVLAIFSVVNGNTHYWVLLTLTAAYSYNGTAVDTITRTVGGAYTGTLYNKWTGGMLNGVFVANNGVDVPQMWNLPAAGTDLVPLTAWPAATTARVLRPFKNFLVALDLTVSSVRDSRLVKWSHSAAPLTVPSSWDVLDPTLDTGEVSLAEGSDPLVDCLPLGDVNIVYTQQQTWAMRLTGTNLIFGFRLLFPTFGLLAPGCVVAFSKDDEGPDSHFVITHDDFKIHNGSSMASVGTDRVRKYFFDTVTITSRQFVHCVKKDDDDEIWVVYPSGGGSSCDRALIWNYRYNTWVTRDLPLTHALGVAYQAPSSTSPTWMDLVGDWSVQTQTWGDVALTQVRDRLVVFDETQQELLEIGEDYTSFDGTTIGTVVERTGLAIKGMQGGQPVVSEDSRAILRRVWPRISGDAGTTITVSVGWQETREDSVTWLTSKTFVVGAKRPVDFVMAYRYLSIRFEESSGARWQYGGFDLEIAPLGKF